MMIYATSTQERNMSPKCDHTPLNGGMLMSHKTYIEDNSHRIQMRSCMHTSYVIGLVLNLDHVPNYIRQKPQKLVV